VWWWVGVCKLILVFTLSLSQAEQNGVFKVVLQLKISNFKFQQRKDKSDKKGELERFSEITGQKATK